MRVPSLLGCLLWLCFANVAMAQHPWQKSPKRSRESVERILGEIEPTEPSRDLHIVWVWGVDRNHAPGFHEYELVRDLFVDLLGNVPRVSVTTAEQFPSPEQWRQADLVVFYLQMNALNQQDFALMDSLLERGGGIVAIHAAMIHPGEEMANRFGLAWERGTTKWGVLPIPSKVNPRRPHGILDGMPRSLDLVDEVYWKLTGDVSELSILATSQAGPEFASTGPPTDDQLDGNDWPIIWTKEIGAGRVFGSIPGHNLFTFNDPYFRIILLRGMAWTMDQPFEPFEQLAIEGLELD